MTLRGENVTSRSDDRLLRCARCQCLTNHGPRLTVRRVLVYTCCECLKQRAAPAEDVTGAPLAVTA